MKKLQIGVIGLGRLGFKHAANLVGRIPTAKLVAVSDPVQEARTAFSDQFGGIDTIADYHDLLARKDIDAIIIATSTNTHGKIIMDGLKAGKAVFCEKPVTLDMNEAAEIRKTLAATKGFVMIGFMRRFDDTYMLAKKRIDSGALGEPVSGLFIGRDPGCPPIEFAKASGGLVLDMAIHDIDLARWFLGGDVCRVYASGGVLMFKELADIGDIDHINIEFNYKSGKIAHLEASRNARYGYDIRSEVICTKGAAFSGDLRQTATQILTPAGCLTDIVPEFRTRFDKAYLTEMECFVDDVLKQNPSKATLEDGIAAVELAFAINRSFKEKQAIDL
jgi:scyllo-inositol 2-dehydrogenase (NAD+)